MLIQCFNISPTIFNMTNFIRRKHNLYIGQRRLRLSLRIIYNNENNLWFVTNMTNFKRPNDSRPTCCITGVPKFECIYRCIYIYIYIRTFSFCLNVSGITVPLILARVSSIFSASSMRPLASNHLGDSGKNLRATEHVTTSDNKGPFTRSHSSASLLNAAFCAESTSYCLRL